MPAPEQFSVSQLGARQFKSPLSLSTKSGDDLCDFTPDTARLLYRANFVSPDDIRIDLSFQKAGPREKIYFDPAATVAAIVTCDGLCPGLNNVIRSVFLQLHHRYGVKQVFGLRYGYCGLNPARGFPAAPLTPEFVESTHKLGGTVLGSSRGPEDPAVVVDFLESMRVNLLFTVGGDGTQRGAHAIAAKVQRRRVPLAVVGIPKTIDNDLPMCANPSVTRRLSRRRAKCWIARTPKPRVFQTESALWSLWAATPAPLRRAPRWPARK